MTRDTDHPSYWITSAPGTPRASITEDARADVVVVGAGIVGLTAAYFLQKEGRRVIVLDRHRIVHRDTGHTSAHLSHVVDTPLPKLARVHGVDTAKAVWDANAFGVDLVERLARDEGIDCGFARVPLHLYAPRASDAHRILEWSHHVRDINYPFQLDAPHDFPFEVHAAILFPDQARFHPREYLLALADRVEAMGGRVHEHAEVAEVDAHAGGDLPVRVRVRDGPTVRARHVIVATNTPFNDRVRMWTRLYPYRSYCVAARVEKGLVPDALYQDTLDPFHYTRIHPEADHDVVILGGEDHRTGHAEHPRHRWDHLERQLKRMLGRDVDVAWRWSAQDAATQDHLAFIGANPGGPANELIACGFNGNGMSYGSLAGWMLAERVLDRPTRWDDLFDPVRFSAKEAARYVKENLTFPRHLVKDHVLSRGDSGTVTDLRPGEGRVVARDGRKIAVSRDADGAFHVMSATCTHLGCAVKWNDAERSWDCPCHGSRFTAEGHVLEGPASDPLQKLDPAEVDLEDAGPHVARPRR